MDDVDRISMGSRLPCPVANCDYVSEDYNPDVARQLLINHVNRNHKES